MTLIKNCVKSLTKFFTKKIYGENIQFYLEWPEEYISRMTSGWDLVLKCLYISLVFEMGQCYFCMHAFIFVPILVSLRWATDMHNGSILVTGDR